MSELSNMRGQRNGWKKRAIEAEKKLGEITKLYKANTGAEPSISCFHRALDEGEEIYKRFQDTHTE